MAGTINIPMLASLNQTGYTGPTSTTEQINTATTLSLGETTIDSIDTDKLSNSPSKLPNSRVVYNAIKTVLDLINPVDISGGIEDEFPIDLLAVTDIFKILDFDAKMFGYQNGIFQFVNTIEGDIPPEGKLNGTFNILPSIFDRVGYYFFSISPVQVASKSNDWFIRVLDQERNEIRRIDFFTGLDPFIIQVSQLQLPAGNGLALEFNNFPYEGFFSFGLTAVRFKKNLYDVLRLLMERLQVDVSIPQFTFDQLGGGRKTNYNLPWDSVKDQVDTIVVPKQLMVALKDFEDRVIELAKQYGGSEVTVGNPSDSLFLRGLNVDEINLLIDGGAFI